MGTEGAGSNGKVSLLTGVGSIMSAMLASLCCVGPLVLALAGVGGVGFLTAFEPYRVPLFGLTAVLLGAGFFVAYRKPVPAPISAEGGVCACPTPKAGRVGRVVLWVALVVAMSAFALPYVVAALWG